MFGYIRTDRPELLVKEDTLYKAAYCSLCKTLGKRYGIAARMLLSYDATFISLFSASINGTALEICRSRCTVNKCKRCNMCRGATEYENYAADITVILLYYKLLDNIRDSTFFKALLFRLIMVFMIPLHNKAVRFAPETEEAAKQYIMRQSEIEKDTAADPDAAADPTAEFGEYIFRNIPGDKGQADKLGYFGRCLGRYIYLIDAFDDLPDDIKHGNFNPYSNRQADTDGIAEELYLTAAMTADALAELNIQKYKDIIENIICGGLVKKIDQIKTEQNNGSISDS